MGSTRWDRISLEPPIVCSLPVLNLPLGGQNQRFKTSKLRSHQKMGAFGCIWMHLLGNPPDFEGKNGHFKIHLTPGRHWILKDTRNHCKMLVVMSLKRQSKVFGGNIGRQKRQDYATWLMIADLRSVLHRWTGSSPKLYRLIVFRVTPLHPALNMACSWVKYPSKSGTVLEVFPVSETSRWLGKYVSLTQLCSSFRPTHSNTRLPSLQHKKQQP